MRKSYVCDRIDIYVGDRVKHRWRRPNRIGTITDIYEEGIDVLWDGGIWLHHANRDLILVESYYSEFLEKVQDRMGML